MPKNQQSKKEYTYGEDNQERTRRVLDVLLAYGDEGIPQGKIKCLKTDKSFTFEISRAELTTLVRSKYPKSDWDNDIYDPISHYLGWLGILQDNRTATRGSRLWKFSLNLWCDSTADNLIRFNDEWLKKKPIDRQKKPIREDSQSQIDWRTACKELLDIQKQQLTSSPIRGGNAKNLDRVHVPLGLVERKEKRPPKFDREQEFSPDRGSEAYHQIETQRIEHDAFLTAVHDRQPGQHLVILGEPGAGKTTLLTKVWESLLKNVDVGEDIIVAWVPLAEVKDGNIGAYLHNTWLNQVCKPREKDAYWAAFEELVDAGRVWLLLDGADEMGSDALMKIETILIKEKWARSTIRAIVTCRLNLWDGSPNRLNSSPNFQIYRTLDFKYISPAGDEVERFIENWFQDAPETGKKLRSALDATGKERIKDLAQNSLRLTLLCDIWEEKQELPDTQFQLYEQFVECVYKHNERKFSTAVALKNELDRAMGDLAKQGINKPTLRFRFSDRELTARLPDLQHRQHLEDLGWLNCVGVDENDQKVYAFFHPTFQEYFAARSIDDWDYFLPRGHVDRPVTCQSGENLYRVFEQEWRHVILLWIGRIDMRNELKEEFINNLTDFKEQGNKFYYYRAYCMAAVCVGEFTSSKYAYEIVQQVVQWALGYFDAQERELDKYTNKIIFYAQKTIPFTNWEFAINALISLLQEPLFIDDNLTLEEEIRRQSEIVWTLGKIATGSERAIVALISLIKNINLDEKVCSQVALRLSKIARGNEKAVTSLLAILESNNLQATQRYRLLFILGEIAEDNQQAIDVMIPLMERGELDENLRQKAASTLGKIAKNNQKTINSFTTLIVQDELSISLRRAIAESLGKIAAKDRIAIDVLFLIIFQYSLDNNWLHSTMMNALCKIAVGDKKAVSALISIIEQNKLNSNHCCDAIEILGKIAVDNKEAIDTLISLIKQNKSNENTLTYIKNALSEIAIGDKKVIRVLLSLVESGKLDNFHRHSVVKILGEIAVKDRHAIDRIVLMIKENDLNNYWKYLLITILDKISIDDSSQVYYLISLFKQRDLDRDLCFNIAGDLGRIAVNDKIAINELILLLHPNDYNNYFRSRTVEILSRIAVGDKMVINRLISIFDENDLDIHLRYRVVESLGMIALNDRDSIDVLIALLDVTVINYRLCDLVLESLCQIAVNDRKAIDTLSLMLSTYNWDVLIYDKIEKALSKISSIDVKTSNELNLELKSKGLNTYFEIEASVNLYKVLNKDAMLSILCSLNNIIIKSAPEEFNPYIEFLFQCAQTITYPEFHAALHHPHTNPHPRNR